MSRHVSPVRPVPSLPSNTPPPGTLEAFLALVLHVSIGRAPNPLGLYAFLDGFQRALEFAMVEGLFTVPEGAHAVASLSMLRGWRSCSDGSWVTSGMAARHSELLSHVEGGNAALSDSPRFVMLSELVRFVVGIRSAEDAPVVAAALRRVFERYGFDASDVESFLGCLVHLVPEEHVREAEGLLEQIGIENEAAYLGSAEAAE